MKNLFLSAIGLIIVLTSCQPDEVNPKEPDYYPIKKGSKWAYEDANTFSLFALGDTLYHDTVYARICTESGFALVLIRKEKGKYYRRTNLYGNFLEERLFLQDNLPVGATWTNLEPWGGKEVNTIVSIDAERIINGKKYNQTIEVKTDYYYEFDQTLTLSYTIQTTYAEGIGVVKSMSQSQGLFGQMQESFLTQYEIK